MKYTLPKTVRKDYITSITQTDVWCERCREQLLVFGRINNITDELMSCEDCDLCSPLKHYSLFCDSCMFRFDTLPMLVR